MASDKEYLSESALNNAVLSRLSSLGQDHAGIAFLVVFPHSEGWKEVMLADSKPAFCGLVQESEQGAKHCLMCHVLMTVTANSTGCIRQRCHMGVTSLVVPAKVGRESAIALVGTCMAPQSDDDVWEEVRQRAKSLGDIKLTLLKRAYKKLPRPSGEQLSLVESILEAAAAEVREISKWYAVERRLNDMLGRGKRKTDVREAVEGELRNAARSLAGAGGSGDPAVVEPRSGTARKTSAMIEVVSGLVDRKPNMRFTVSEIAAAARMTPNYFSTLFRRHKGQTFSEFLIDRRISKAKELLEDLTLNVAEVAEQSGYDDPGYFARLFKQRTSLSPRQWREQSTGRKV